jgi:ABC-type branched-subunit amino acid transport system ATPase component
MLGDPTSAGCVVLNDVDVTKLRADQRQAMWLGVGQERQRISASMTVEQN